MLEGPSFSWPTGWLKLGPSGKMAAGGAVVNMDADAKPRLFFGLKLTDEVRPQVVSLIERLQQTDVKVKWVEPENLHFTLKFLGWMPALVLPTLSTIGQQLAAQTAPWSLTLHGVGAFPKIRYPQVVFVGSCDGAERLTRLATNLDRMLAECAIAEAEKRAFVAHCTLGRVKQTRGVAALAPLLEAEREFEAGPMTCTHFSLLQSELRRSGPIYTEIENFAFGAG